MFFNGFVSIRSVKDSVLRLVRITLEKNFPDKSPLWWNGVALLHLFDNEETSDEGLRYGEKRQWFHLDDIMNSVSESKTYLRTHVWR